MKTKRKILRAFFVALLVLLSASAGLIWYLYSHPLLMKTWIEKTVSGSMGATLTIGELEYSLDPFRISGKKIRFSPGAKVKGFNLFFPDFSADFLLEGPFGNRVLVCKSITLRDFSGRVHTDSSFLEDNGSSPVSSLSDRIISRMISIFLFRDVKIQRVEIADGQMEIQSGDLDFRFDKIQSHLNADYSLEFLCSIHAGLPAENIGLMIPQVSLKTDGPLSFGDSGTSFSFHFENAVLESPQGKIHDLSAKAKLFYQHSLGKMAFSGVTIAWDKAVLGSNGVKEVLSGSSMTFEGEFGLKNYSLQVNPVALKAANLFQIEGKLNAGLAAPRRFQLEVSKGTAFPGRLLPLIKEKIDPLSATVSGPITLAGIVNGFEEGGNWDWDCDLNASFEDSQVSLLQGEKRFQGTLSGKAQVNGRYPHLREAVLLNVEDAAFSNNGVLLESFEASVSFSGAYPQYNVNNLSVRIPRMNIMSGKTEFSLSSLEVKGKGGSVHAETRAVSFPAIFFDSSLLKNIRISLQSDRERTDMTVTGEGTNLLQSALHLGWLPSGWTAEGRDRIEIKAECRKDGECSMTSQIVFPELSFQNSTGDRVGEKIFLNLQFAGKTTLYFERASFDASVIVDKGEVLWDRFYLSLQEHPMSIHGEGLYTEAERRLRLFESTCSLKGIVDAKVEGDLFRGGHGHGLDLQWNIPAMPVEPLFRYLVKEPFRMEKPAFAGLELKGEISAGLQWKADLEDREIKGHVLWRDGLLSSSEHDVRCEGVDLSIPVWYRVGDMDRSSGRMKGKINIGSLNIPFLPKQPLNMELAAGPNHISVDTPTLLRVPGGEVRVAPVEAKEIFGPDLSLNTGISMEDLSTEPLLAGIWPHPVKGSISGTLKPIHFKKGTLSAGGTMRAHVFGGEIVLSHAGASGLFSSAPVFHVNVGLNDLALLQLTAGTPFGEIEGVLNGFAENIEISNGQLQKFNLLLETTKKKGVSQTISVKAVDNIARLGGSQSPFVGVAGMFMVFFKEFPYEKIGIRATLENDLFRINGTILDGGKEYFIKRGFLSGVDVVNQNRDNVVSFKDMLKRIKRISAAKGAPVIQ